MLRFCKCLYDELVGIAIYLDTNFAYILACQQFKCVGIAFIPVDHRKCDSRLHSRLTASANELNVYTVTMCCCQQAKVHDYSTMTGVDLYGDNRPYQG